VRRPGGVAAQHPAVVMHLLAHGETVSHAVSLTES
jgi:hypothetical protein